MTPELRASVLSQARDTLGGEARAVWTPDWPYEWAIVLVELDGLLTAIQDGDGDDR